MSRVTLLGTVLALVLVPKSAVADRDGGSKSLATATGVWASDNLRTEVGAPAQWEEQLSRDPYDYEAHRMLVNAYRRAGRYDQAFLEAAWLAWLAPKDCAASEQGLPYLRDRRARDRAASARGGRAEVVVAAVDVRRSLYDCCADGAVGQQATRLRTEVEETLARLQRASEAPSGPGGFAAEASPRTTSARPGSPVARMAMTDIYLALDDILALEGAGDSQRARAQALRAAASQAEAASAALPEAPGPHRALAVICGRLAELSGPSGPRGVPSGSQRGNSERWGLAIAECEHAYRLDPKDTALPEMLWALTLHAGRWEEAKRWEAAVTSGGR